MLLPNYIEVARKYAIEHEFDSEQTFRHCSIAVNGGKILSIGFNRKYNKFLRFEPDVARMSGRFQNEEHAEFQAVSKYLSKIADASRIKVYVVRIHRNGSLANSNPCVYCRNYLQNVGLVKKVVYSISDNEFGTWYPNR